MATKQRETVVDSVSPILGPISAAVSPGSGVTVRRSRMGTVKPYSL